MNASVYLVALIILAAGIVGGLAAHLTQPKPADSSVAEPAGDSIRRFVLLGIIASACVPLFLSLLKSQLIQSIFTTTGSDGKALPPAYESYLIFIGLCLIAAFAARKFIDSVSNQIFQRLEEVDAKATKADATATAAKEVAQETAEEVEAADNLQTKALPADLKAVAALDAVKDDEPVSITPVERKILSAMTNRTYRTRTGIAEDSGVSRSRISDLLESLADRKLALPTKSPRTGGDRWIITKRGRATLDASS